MAHKTLLPVQHNQERTTLRRTSSSLSDSAERLKPMLHSGSIYNVTSEPSLVSTGVVANVERYGGSIAAQRKGRACSPVLFTMASTNGALPVELLHAPRPLLNDPGFGQVCVDPIQVCVHLGAQRPLTS